RRSSKRARGPAQAASGSRAGEGARRPRSQYSWQNLTDARDVGLARALQVLEQLCAGPMQTLAKGFGADAADGRRLHRFEALDTDEQKHFAIVERQRGERRFEAPLCFARGGFLER